MASSKKAARSDASAQAHARAGGRDAGAKSPRSGPLAKTDIRVSECDAGAKSNLPSYVRDFLIDRPSAGRRICVALSGGLDSVVLLHLLFGLRDAFGFALSAVHVHHGLSPNADAWADFCGRLCAEWAVPLARERVCVERDDPRGIEAAARAARYAAFARQACDDLMLAHHRDDQAETLLLQLLRGAGIKGLAAMPAERVLDAGPIRLLRPLLAADRADLQAYAEAHGLRHVDDESNIDVGHARNFLRHRALPLIEQHFPAYRATLTRAARHFADGAELIEELARLDAAEAMVDGCLRVSALAVLSPARARNLLRHYLALHAWPVPSAAWLAQALEQLLQARPDAEPRVSLAGHELVRYRDRIQAFERTPARVAGEWPWRGEAILDLGELGVLAFTATQGGGVSQARLMHDATVRPYPGGAKLRPDCRRSRRSVKNLLQEAAVPPWARRQLPALYCDGQLVWLAGIGIDCAFQAGPDEPGWLISWRRPPGSAAR